MNAQNTEHQNPRVRRHNTPLHQLPALPRAQWRRMSDVPATASSTPTDPRATTVPRLRAQFLEAATQYKMIEILERKHCVLQAKEWELAMEEFLRGIAPNIPYSPVDLEMQMEKFLRGVLEKNQHGAFANSHRFRS